jgi:hypothetical protein
MRTLIIIVLLATSILQVFLFIAKWIDTDIDTAWKAFEDHVDNCLGKL